MKTKCYINGIGMVGAQDYSPRENSLFSTINEFNTPILRCQFSEYEKYIKKGMMRRMSSSVKMGSVAAKKALEDAKIEEPDAIITGTGMGCKQDSDIFLENLLQQHEELLTPTKFIQSTHNTVGGQLALQLQSKVYNSTFVQGSISFESALIDAQLSICSSEKNQEILVGGIDEISLKTIGLHQLNGQVKKESEIKNINLLDYKTTGSIAGEGASFFVISTEKKAESYAELTALTTFNSLKLANLKEEIDSFLTENKLTENDIDAVILGKNGDVDDDEFYQEMEQKIFPETPQIYYKHLTGEFYTASSVGFGLGAHILKDNSIPESCKLNNVEVRKPIQRVLLYNQYHGRNHSFIVLEKC